MELKDELIKNFHEQFAQNQNHHQKLFFQILSVIVTVTVGYSYVYTMGGKLPNPDLKPSIFLLSLALIISTIVLGLSLVLLSNMAYGFRRDQFVNNRIREKANLIHNSNSKDDIFPKSYDPAWSFIRKNKAYKKRLKKLKFPLRYTYGIWVWILMRLSWMPNFHNSLFFMLSLIQILLLISYVCNPFDDIILFDLGLGINWAFIVTICTWLILTGLVLRSQSVFYRKLKELYS
ncbi:hypothetical protein [Flagellimonas onchidii]|uniref:hypothetical protein n=1 Tax=Flagellimonas onchidii TaxID=2562684 RepID=UPI0010A5E4FD|nr:hypothetical protein [Allomuricauda onchidii]